MPATTTVQNIIDRVFEELGIVSTNSIAGLAEPAMIRYINSAQRKVLNQPEILWDFMSKSYSFNIKADSTLSVAATAGNTSVTITDSSSWPASGKVIIDGEEKTYTANAANVLTLSSALTADHSSGTIVSLCYAFPTDARKPNELWIRGTTGDGRGVRYNYEDYRMFETLRLSSASITTVDLFSLSEAYRVFFWHDGYMYLPYHTEARLGLLKYTKEPTTLDSSGDILDIPDHETRLLDAIYELVLARCYKVMKRYDRAGQHAGLAQEIILEVVGEAETKTNKIHNKAPKTYFGKLTSSISRRR